MSELPLIRRIVTGHAADGTAIVVENGNVPTIVSLENIPGTLFQEMWATPSVPAPITLDNGPDPTVAPVSLPPPAGGTRFRFVDIPPDTDDFLQNGAERMDAMFKEIGDAHASTVTESSPHPLMHRTESIDYGVVIEGEIVLILDKEEVALKRGDVVIQRGTNHSWANRSDKLCRMLFVLVSGQFDPALADAIKAYDAASRAS